MSLVLAAALSMPLPPPPPIVLGFGSIPESREGPLYAYPETGVAAAMWSCTTTLGPAENITISGRFDAIQFDPSLGPSPKWPGFTIAKVEPGPGHKFEGTYLATHSPNAHTIYGFSLAQDGDAYELTVRMFDFKQLGTIKIDRLHDDEWVEAGKGSCTGRRIDSEGKPAS